MCANGCAPGGSDVSLIYPRTVQRIHGDGNCLYRALVYAITGSESQHYRLRCLIVEHLRSLTGTEQELRLHGSLIGNYDTVEEYIVHSQMDQLGSWGSEVEMALLAHRLGINVASFNATANTPPLTPDLQHFRTTSMSDVDIYLFTQWEKCLKDGVQLPAKYIRTYSADGNILDVQHCSIFKTVSATPSDTQVNSCGQRSAENPCRPVHEQHVQTSTPFQTQSITPCSPVTERMQDPTPSLTPSRRTDGVTERMQDPTPSLTPSRRTDGVTERMQDPTPSLTPCRRTDRVTVNVSYLWYQQGC